MYNPLDAGLKWLARRLAGVGLIDAERGERTADLAWPRMITGFARMSQRVADFAMVGMVLGPPALAGMAFALAYWQIGNTLSLGLSGGTISLVSQRFGAGDDEGIDLVIKGSVWIALVLGIPLTVAFWLFPTPLIALLGGDPVAVGYGADYLRIAGLAVGFEFLNKVSSRTLVGADDARIPMLIRGTGASVNIVLNAVFIFGLGMGVVGAALGTLVATVLVTVAFTWGFLTGGLVGVGRFPVGIRPSRPYLHVGLTRQLLTIASPLMGRMLAQTIAVFPLLAMVATFGPVVVAAFEVARRIRGLLTAPNWGFSLASSSLVGQHLGEDDEAEARAYGWDILRFAVVVHVVTATLVVIFARPIAAVFVDEPAALATAVPFVRVAAVSVIGFGVDGVSTGVLQGGGDTRWPFYGKVLGLYGFALPLAYVGTTTALGLVGLYLALLAETVVPAVVSFYRFSTDRWLAISRSYRSTPGD